MVIYLVWAEYENKSWVAGIFKSHESAVACAEAQAKDWATNYGVKYQYHRSQSGLNPDCWYSSEDDGIVTIIKYPLQD